MPESTATVEFLIEPENIEPVMEILRHGEEIRMLILSRFWTALFKRLHETVPKKLQAKTLSWEANTTPTEVSEPYAAITLSIAGSQQQAQALRFRIQQLVLTKVKSFELFFGLHWKIESSTTPRALELREVIELKAYQEKIGLECDKNPWWLGWKYLW